MNFNRRSFIGSGIAALGALELAHPSTANAQLIYKRTDWNDADFNKLLHHPARMKQVYDIRPIGGGKFLNNIKNSLNGFQFGYGVPATEIKIVAALHGPSNMLNFDDSMWAKYRLGEWLDVNDPKTGKPATRNPFLSAGSDGSTNLDDHNSIYENTSIQALQKRGVQLLSCHTATEEQMPSLVAHNSIKTPAKDIVLDLQAHTLPGVQIVPAMVAAISILQSEGHFTYITV